MSGHEDSQTSRRDYHAAYSSKHPLPTVQQYKDGKEQETARLAETNNQQERQKNDTTLDAIHSFKSYFKGARFLDATQLDSEEQDEAPPDSNVNLKKYQASQATRDARLRPSENNQTNQATQNATLQPAKPPAASEQQRQKTSQNGSHLNAEQNISKDERREKDTSQVQETTQQPKERSKDERREKDTSQVQETAQQPKERAKVTETGKQNRNERQVTDPVTHLPITIHDFNDTDLNNISAGYSPWKKGSSVKTDPYSQRKKSGLEEDAKESQKGHEGLESVFPPPEYSMARNDMTRVYSQGIIFGLGAIIAICLASFLSWFLVLGRLISGFIGRSIIGTVLLTASCGGGAVVVWGVQEWVGKKVTEVWEDEVWEAERRNGRDFVEKSEYPESTQWLNMLLGSVWPLINPDLFNSLADTLEDVMQASLPKLVRMVSVEDLGQGSESFRILGVRWLPKGAAGHSVTENGELKSGGKTTKSDQSNRERDAQNDIGETHDADQGTEKSGAKDKAPTSGSQDPKGQGSMVAAGMEAEEGEFVNVEIAFSYRSSKRRFRDQENNPHILLVFYLPANIRFPVWVELSGLVGTLRARLQIIPDPPFVALCTITFLGQPKVDMSCMPLTKKGLNIMDLPLISNFVQTSIDAAMSEYVAPKSQTLDLKAMLAGDDFKKDTLARGVMVVRIKRAFDFKEGDVSIPLISSGGSDPYVSLGWAKYGKSAWSTRVILNEMHPYFEETGYLLVTPEELNADESLRLQLWDSDRVTADDHLGMIELPLKPLMKDERSNGRMWDRTDPFKALEAGEPMPGRLDWSVGYFSKTRLTDDQVRDAMDDDCDIKTVQQLKDKIEAQSTKKLREAAKNEKAEVEQQKTQDWLVAQIDMITSLAPPQEYLSGILSIQIHQINGLEFEKTSKARDTDGGDPDDSKEETGESLPNSYCTIILNHQTVYKTRTKPRSSKPFFNACTERFIRDWRSTSLFIAVRDRRIHEDDPLLGIVHLPLAKLFKTRSRINEHFPIAGGIGHGRIRISLVFRSIQLQATQLAPPNSPGLGQTPPYHLGWDYGTLELRPEVSCSADLPKELRGHRLKFRTTLRKGTMHTPSRSNDEGKWTSKKNRPIMLPVRNRYSANLIVEFRASMTLLPDKTPAFAILWLKDIPDEESKEMELTVWRGDLKRADKNILPAAQLGEKQGVLKLKAKFWRGLGRWHRPYAKHAPEVAQVLDVLDCANDVNEADDLVGYGEWRKRDMTHAGSDSDASSSSSSDDDDGDSNSDANKAGGGGGGGGADDVEDVDDGVDVANGAQVAKHDSAKSGLLGVVDRVKSTVHRQESLNRRQRGIMQWKTPRTVAWGKHKVERMADKIGAKFEHHERLPGVETEV